MKILLLSSALIFHKLPSVTSPNKEVTLTNTSFISIDITHQGKHGKDSVFSNETAAEDVEEILLDVNLEEATRSKILISPVGHGWERYFYLQHATFKLKELPYYAAINATSFMHCKILCFAQTTCLSLSMSKNGGNRLRCVHSNSTVDRIPMKHKAGSWVIAKRKKMSLLLRRDGNFYRQIGNFTYEEALKKCHLLDARATLPVLKTKRNLAIYSKKSTENDIWLGLSLNNGTAIWNDDSVASKSVQIPVTWQEESFVYYLRNSSVFMRPSNGSCLSKVTVCQALSGLDKNELLFL